MIIYLYRWRLKPEKVQQFEDAWAFVTKQLLQAGSFGSRLHVGNDGIYYGYAQWPNAEARSKAQFNGAGINEAREKMLDAVVEAFPEVVLNPLRDYLEMPEIQASSQRVPALNQVTVGSKDLDQSISFYKVLGLSLIVKSSHYARFECPNGATLSLELLKAHDKAGPTVVYLEHPRLDEWVLALKKEKIVFEQELEDKPWAWREAVLKDPFGNRICLFYAGKNRRFPPWRI